LSTRTFTTLNLPLDTTVKRFSTLNHSIIYRQNISDVDVRGTSGCIYNRIKSIDLETEPPNPKTNASTYHPKNQSNINKMQIINLLTSFLTFLFFTSTTFAASGWTGTCTTSTMVGSALVAVCYDAAGQIRTSVLDLDLCITNNQGWLGVCTFLFSP
jgi:hypothetical protein